jgi:hypothetical protein
MMQDYSPKDSGNPKGPVERFSATLVCSRYNRFVSIVVEKRGQRGASGQSAAVLDCSSSGIVTVAGRVVALSCVLGDIGTGSYLPKPFSPEAPLRLRMTSRNSGRLHPDAASVSEADSHGRSGVAIEYRRAWLKHLRWIPFGPHRMALAGSCRTVTLSALPANPRKRTR